MPEIKTNWITLKIADGTSMRGQARQLIRAQSLAGADLPQEMTGQAVSLDGSSEGKAQIVNGE